MDLLLTLGSVCSSVNNVPALTQRFTGKGCAIALLIVFSPLILALALALLPFALLLALVLGFLSCIGRCVSGSMFKRFHVHVLALRKIQYYFPHTHLSLPNADNGETLNGPAPAKWQSLEVLDASGSKMPLEHLWRGPENAITVIAILRHIG